MKILKTCTVWVQSTGLNGKDWATGFFLRARSIWSGRHLTWLTQILFYWLIEVRTIFRFFGPAAKKGFKHHYLSSPHSLLPLFPPSEHQLQPSQLAFPGWINTNKISWLSAPADVQRWLLKCSTSPSIVLMEQKSFDYPKKNERFSTKLEPFYFLFFTIFSILIYFWYCGLLFINNLVCIYMWLTSFF